MYGKKKLWVSLQNCLSLIMYEKYELKIWKKEKETNN
jgi:hypothetical protein